MEHRLVYTIALATWKLDRTEEIEVEIVNLQTRYDLTEFRLSTHGMDAPEDVNTPKALSYARSRSLPQGRDGSLLMRYRNDANRLFWKAHAELRKLQAERRKEEASAAAPSTAAVLGTTGLLGTTGFQPVDPTPPAETPGTTGFQPVSSPPATTGPQPVSPSHVASTVTPQPHPSQLAEPQVASNGAAAAEPKPPLSKNAMKRLRAAERQRVEKEEKEKILAGKGSIYLEPAKAPAPSASATP